LPTSSRAKAPKPASGAAPRDGRRVSSESGTSARTSPDAATQEPSPHPPGGEQPGAPTIAPAITPPQGWPAAWPRIAVYREPESPPQLIALQIPASSAQAPNEAPAEDLSASTPQPSMPQLLELLTARAHAAARDQGGVIPLSVFRELIDNLVHASFDGVVVTILDGGNTLRISDQGPGIPDKEAALRPGFTSADAGAKQYIRGVGSGLPVVQRTLAALGGTLEIEDNLGKGTVVTARVSPPLETPLAPIAPPEYNLTERQLKVLLLTVELAPVGPTRIAEELGVSTSTAYRDLVSLEQADFVFCQPTGHRTATDAGLAYLSAVL
jgi:hypothetical protein